MILTPKTRWIFWDLDGTLIDSLPALYEAYASFVRSKGHVPSQKDFDKLNGPTIGEIVLILKKRFGLQESYEKLLAEYTEYLIGSYQAKAKMMPGAKKSLMVLKSAGFRMALVTSSYKRFTGPILKKLGIGHYFEMHTYGNEVKNSKPHPDIYVLAVKKARASVKSVVVIEDSKRGVQAANRAGLKTIQVSRDLTNLSKQVLSVFAQHDEIMRLDTKNRLRLLPKKVVRKENHLFCATSMKKTADNVDVLGRFIPYQEYKKKRLELTAMAVSGIVVKGKAAKESYLVGKRSDQVFTYKNFWELVPSGGVDTSSVNKSKTIDLKKMILTEFSEEIGVSKSHAKLVKLIGMVGDSKAVVWEIAFKIHVGNDFNESGFHKKEYSEMRFLKADKLEKLFHSKSNVVPSSRLIWDLYQNKSGGEL